MISPLGLPQCNKHISTYINICLLLQTCVYLYRTMCTRPEIQEWSIKHRKLNVKKNKNIGQLNVLTSRGHYLKSVLFNFKKNSGGTGNTAQVKCNF